MNYTDHDYKPQRQEYNKTPQTISEAAMSLAIFFGVFVIVGLWVMTGLSFWVGLGIVMATGWVVFRAGKEVRDGTKGPAQIRDLPLTEDEFCDAYTQYHGDGIDKVAQLVRECNTGKELMEFCNYIRAIAKQRREK